MSAHVPLDNILYRIAPADMDILLERSNLSSTDRIIAVERYNHCATLADIGAIVHMDRSTVGYRLSKVINPRLLYLLGDYFPPKRCKNAAIIPPEAYE